MNKEIEAILVDVDGCLIPTDGDVSPELYKGLNRISEYVKMANLKKSPPLGFCSGRDRNYIEAVSFLVGLPNSWSVIESGIAIFNPATKQLIFNPELTEKKMAIFEEVKKMVPEILKKYPDLFLYPGNMVCLAFERKYKAITTIEDAYNYLKKEVANLHLNKYVEIRHSDCSVDISPKEIDKASGVKFLSRYAGINLKKTLAIGDSNNDFPLFEQVGYVACPKNASKECKGYVQRKGGIISPFCYADGVAFILQNLFS